MYMSTKSHIHETYGTLKKTSFCTKGYAEIHIEMPFFDNKNSIWKILQLKIQMAETCFSASSKRTIFIFKISIFGGILKLYHWADVCNFWQFWAVLGRFCCIGNGWQHAQRSHEILKTSKLLNHKSKLYL
jgi:hypothetical protein